MPCGNGCTVVIAADAIDVIAQATYVDPMTPPGYIDVRQDGVLQSRHRIF
jgi:hypothetical protein